MQYEGDVLPDESQTQRVALEGDLDLNRKREVERLLPPPDPNKRVVIDFSRVTSVDSAVIRVFMHYRRQYIEAGGDALANIVIIVSPQVRRVFDITGLSRWVTVINATRE